MSSLTSSNLRVAVIGAGPAGLGAARAIRDTNASVQVTIFDKGRRLSARACPVDRGLNCDACKGICNVISGFAGSIHFGDAIKLSRLPAGRRLGSLLGNRYDEFELRALAMFGIGPDRFSSGSFAASEVVGLRSYPVAELSELEVMEWIRKVHAFAASSCKLMMRTRVLDLDLDSKAFVLRTASGKTEKTERFDAVVVASGRAGIADCAKWTVKHSVAKRNGSPSVGLRFEMPAEILAHLYAIHRDFKVSSTAGKYKIKSFCFSSHPSAGGRIKYCHYQDQFDRPVIFLDGHMNSELGAPTQKGNFALLAQIPPSKAAVTTRQLIDRYWNDFGGRPVWQPLRELLTEDGIRAGKDETPSVPDVQRGDVSTLFPEGALQDIIDQFRAIGSLISARGGPPAAEIIESTVVLAPAVEFFWDEIVVSEQFESSVRNLFFVGDCAGLAQGNLQAAISGIVAGQAIGGRIA